MTDKNSLISVIVPIYCIERYLGICIESIINQTYRNLEIILVDDGSPDRCPEICDLYAKKDSRIKVIHKLNGGLVSARKAGLAASTGRYIGYVDGDDWISPEFYESLYTSIKTSEADIIAAGQSRDLFSKSKHFLNNIPCGIYEGEKLDGLRREMISHGDFYRPGVYTYVWNKLFKREVLMNPQMNVDERISIGEDAAVVYPAIMECSRVYVTDNCAYHYRQREDSMLKKSTPFKEEIKKLKYLYDYLSAFAAQYGDQYRLKEQINDFVLSICIMRSGAMVDSEDFLPYSRDFKNKDVVIYSAGTFGQQLVNRFKESGHCRLKAWIDDDYWEYRRCCLDVDSVESVTQADFDFILLATVDGSLSQKIRKRLLDYGVSGEKILSVYCPCEIRDSILRKYMKISQSSEISS